MTLHSHNIDYEHIETFAYWSNILFRRIIDVRLKVRLRVSVWEQAHMDSVEAVAGACAQPKLARGQTKDFVIVWTETAKCSEPSQRPFVVRPIFWSFEQRNSWIYKRLFYTNLGHNWRVGMRSARSMPSPLRVRPVRLIANTLNSENGDRALQSEAVSSKPPRVAPVNAESARVPALDILPRPLQSGE